MTIPGVGLILFYWIFLSCVFFMTGAYVSRVLITDPSGADVCYFPGKQKCFGETSARMVILISIIALTAHALFLIMQASVISDTPLSEVSSVIGPFLLKTRYGRFSVLRMALLAVVLFVSYAATKKGGRRIALAGGVLSFLILVSIGMSGHQGTRGLSASLFIDVFHIGTVSVWIGGLFYIRFCYSFFMNQAGVEFFSIFRDLIMRFSRMATVCVIVGASAGVGLGFINVRRLPDLTDTTYGRVLLLKSLVVALLVSLGGINKFILLPHLNRSGAEQWAETARYRTWLRRVITAEVAAGFAILLITSLLSHLSPEN